MATQQSPHYDELLTASEVAEMLCVDPKTVTKWAREGKLPFTRTRGGRRWYYRRDIATFLNGHEPQRLYLPGVVARRFRVDSKTVARWAKTGLLNYIMTPGGHRRYLSAEVDRLLQTRRD